VNCIVYLGYMMTIKYDTINLESSSQLIGYINLSMKLLGKPTAVTPPGGFDVAGAGNVELHLTRQCLTLPEEGLVRAI
jgi:hypothetical protein